MIDLNEFSDIVSMNGPKVTKSYINLSGDTCHFRLCADDYKAISDFFGPTVNVKANADFSTIVFLKGNDRRIATNTKSISLNSSEIKAMLRKLFGDNIQYLYFKGGWDETKTHEKVYVFRTTKQRVYNSDMTVRKLK